MTADSNPNETISSIPSSPQSTTMSTTPTPQTICSRRKPYHNPLAAAWVSSPSPNSTNEILAFHQKFSGSGYAPTPLISLPSIAKELGVRAVYVKDESSRCGLPSFKILGASWATCRAIASYTNVPATTDPAILAEAAKTRGIVLVAATDGNHGRAVAKFAAVMGLKARILVPSCLDEATVDLIRGEGAEVSVENEDYDGTVLRARDVAASLDAGILIQDTAFEGYEEIPQWIVDGYSTMMSEIEIQLEGKSPDLIVTPVGVGSFAQAVVSHSKAASRGTRVLAVEPDSAGCLWKSLSGGSPMQVKTRNTIMSGMNCGTVSTLAWPILQAGVDVSVTISDIEAHEAVDELSKLGVNAGPCGSSTLAALRYSTTTESLGLTKDSVVVLLSTEGSREYTTPIDVRISDSVDLTQALVRIDSTNPGLSKAGGAGEKAIAQYITAWLEHRNIESHWLEDTPDRPSVIGIVRGSGGGKSIMLNGHLDTVTTAGYEGDPLTGHIKDGAMYGRGIMDMKAGLAASLVALVRANGANLRGDVIFAGVADEENLSLGTEEILRAGWRADGAIVAEPSLLDVIIAHKGFVWFEVDIFGRASHGSQYQIGIDAILKAGHFLKGLDDWSREILRGKGDKQLGTGSIHAGLIQGGEEPSSYPAKCTITIERRTVPGETVESTTQELQTILELISASVPDFKYDLRATFVRPPFQILRDDLFVQCAVKGVEKVLRRPAVLTSVPFWADTALLSEKGIPAIAFGVNGEGLHGKCEWATVESIKQVTEALSNIVGDFCK